jgi:DNA-binding NarL/FixJ family response regulator
MQILAAPSVSPATPQVTPIVLPVPQVHKVVVVDGHEVTRVGVTRILESSDRFGVVGSLSSGEQAIRLIRHTAPDVAVMNFRLSGRNGAWTCAELLQHRPRLAVLIMTDVMNEEILLACLRAGARGFLMKSAKAGEVVDAVARLADGEPVLTSQAVPIVMDFARNAKRQWTGGNILTSDETEILRAISLGRSNRQIAETMHVSEETLKSSVRVIKRRLGVKDRAHAVAIAAKRGLI